MSGRASSVETERGGLSGYTFRRVEIHELPLVNDLYNNYYQTNRSLAEADWLYRRNAYGEGIIFGAYDAQGHLVGVRPTIAWRFSWGGRERQAYQFTDALVAPEHRGKGIFSRLVKDMCALAAERDFILWSFPNSNSLPIYLKMGMLERVAGCQVLVKVLAWRKYIQYKLGRRAGPASSPVVDPGPRITAGDLSLVPIGRFQSDFEDVHAELGSMLASFTLRGRDYLNWRYFEHPEQRYQVALIQLGGQTQGYVVVRILHGIVHVIDVFARPTAGAVKGLPHLLTMWARQKDAIALYFAASTGNVFARAFRRAGFLLRRKSGYVVLDTRSASQLARTFRRPLESGDFYFTIGDSDTEPRHGEVVGSRPAKTHSRVA
jgi:GNAT superfamily N-acetyltransferase